MDIEPHRKRVFEANYADVSIIFQKMSIEQEAPHDNKSRIIIYVLTSPFPKILVILAMCLLPSDNLQINIW